ncbi:MAG: hypothetical protein J0L58_18710 [Burkholderiales bacterium]|nr:hypothetical protein [Burkholderiales bacterium]
MGDCVPQHGNRQTITPSLKSHKKSDTPPPAPPARIDVFELERDVVAVQALDGTQR